MNKAEERLEQLKANMEYLGISQAAAAAAVGVSPKTIGNYLSGVTSGGDSIRKIEVFLRSREFYRGYCFQGKDEFHRLFCRLWDKCKEIRSTEELCEMLQLTLSEVNHIRENRKALDVRMQYDILFQFHELCRDSTGVYRPGFEESGENLRLLLGLDFPVSVTREFSDLLNSLLADLDFTPDDEALARAAGIPPEDLTDLRHDNDCPYNVWEKCDILDALRCLCGEHASKEAQDVLHRLNWQLSYYDGRKVPPEQIRECRIEEKIWEFRTYNDAIQNIILSHGRAFFNPPELFGFPQYLRHHSVPAALKLGKKDTIAEFDYLRSIMELFRLLPEQGREEIFDLAAKGFTMPSPCPQFSNGPQGFETLIQYLELALLTQKKGRLSNLNPEETMPNLRRGTSVDLSPIPSWWWIRYNSESVNYKLGFDSREWCLWAMLYAAVRSLIDLNPLIRRMLDLLTY